MRCYAIRQLNPFEGTLQVIEQGLARAFSANGRLWRVQVMAERPQHTWRSEDAPCHPQYFNWGFWSREQGMQRVTANPILDIGTMQQAADALVAALAPRLDDLPFPLEDRFEYWACEPDGRPVALLAAVCNRREAQGAPATAWRALPFGEHGFVSPALEAAGLPSADSHSPRLHADRLEAAVRRRAQARHWFARTPDGGGERLHDGARLPAAAFPPLTLTGHWEDPLLAGLVRDYLDWLAPLLLTLSGLPDSLRARLEAAASRRATLVAEVHRLYPEVLDPERLRQTRVEARLRRAHPPTR